MGPCYFEAIMDVKGSALDLGRIPGLLDLVSKIGLILLGCVEVLEPIQDGGFRYHHCSPP